ncbi:Fur family transcriptional regulator [Novosphingobium terrae]|uniref:Fur family transcriptional regulator n=1 Tax=Novosphingobium terrae TaxID=2726189 RepID=UPI00197DCBB8|nr:transcriptional repressor [Novosphingobium terrae]
MGAVKPRIRRSPQQNEALIMQALMQANGPLSAYDIARVASHESGVIVPGQVYRTLERLIQQRRVLRIEMLNAYLPRPQSGHLCLICTICHDVSFIEAPQLQACVTQVSAAYRFTPSSGMIETLCHCRACGEPTP